jgi:hypothetical protein
VALSRLPGRELAPHISIEIGFRARSGIACSPDEVTLQPQANEDSSGPYGCEVRKRLKNVEQLFAEPVGSKSLRRPYDAGWVICRLRVGVQDQGLKSDDFLSPEVLILYAKRIRQLEGGRTRRPAFDGQGFDWHACRRFSNPLQKYRPPRWCR